MVLRMVHAKTHRVAGMNHGSRIHARLPFYAKVRNNVLQFTS
jgi:hypothetical protein